MAWTRMEAVALDIVCGKPLRFVEILNVRYERKREVKNDFYIRSKQLEKFLSVLSVRYVLGIQIEMLSKQLNIRPRSSGK